MIHTDGSKTVANRPTFASDADRFCENCGIELPRGVKAPRSKDLCDPCLAAQIRREHVSG